MTLTRPDKISPAQPPPDGGARMLLGFVAVTAAAYVLGALAAGAFFSLVSP